MLRFFLAVLILTFSLYGDMLFRTKVGMGTFVTISLDEKSKEHFENSFKIMSDVEASLSSYNPNSKIYKLNANKEIELDIYTYEALKLSEKYYIQTDKYFDITVGAITKDLFHFGEEEHVPNAEELQNAELGFTHFCMGETKACIKENIKVDLGGMGKGYGVDKVIAYLKSQDINKSVVAASGDIRCLDRCHIDVQSPFTEGFLASFDTKNTEVGISTSGNYNRYVQTKENNHLINPKIKKPQQNFISVTLISELPSADLDAYATAVSVMPQDKAYEFLQKMQIEYIILQADKKLVISKNISRLVENLIIYRFLTILVNSSHDI